MLYELRVRREYVSPALSVAGLLRAVYGCGVDGDNLEGMARDCDIEVFTDDTNMPDIELSKLPLPMPDNGGQS